MRNYSRQTSRGEYQNSCRNNSYDGSRNRSRERSFSRNYGNNRTGSKATVDPGQNPEQVQIGIELYVVSVGNMIILQGTVPLLGKKRR